VEPARASSSSRVQHSKPLRREGGTRGKLLSRRSWAVVLAAFLLTACGSSGPSSTPSSMTTPTGPMTSAAGTTSMTVPSATPFVSRHYGYVITSEEWTGTDATAAWDGTGSPGHDDPAVDILKDLEGHAAFAFGERSDATLQRFVTAFRRTNATVHAGCPVRPEKTGPITIGNEPAILDQMHCPPSGGPFVLTAYVVHAGRAYVFATLAVALSDAATRLWFVSLLKDVSFEV
jgi:hypothetical protein